MYESNLKFQTCSGAMIPGQLGPINLLLFCCTNKRFTSTISRWGIPSVIQTISGISASIASMMALAAPGGGTYMTVASAPVADLAYVKRCLFEHNR